jgi:hypothetical protein
MLRKLPHSETLYGAQNAENSCLRAMAPRDVRCERTKAQLALFSGTPTVISAGLTQFLIISPGSSERGTVLTPTLIDTENRPSWNLLDTLPGPRPPLGLLGQPVGAAPASTFCIQARSMFCPLRMRAAGPCRRSRSFRALRSRSPALGDGGA